MKPTTETALPSEGEPTRACPLCERPAKFQGSRNRGRVLVWNCDECNLLFDVMDTRNNDKARSERKCKPR